MNNFQLQLKAKDEEYVKALKRQADDIDDLLERMRSELKELQVRRKGFPFKQRSFTFHDEKQNSPSLHQPLASDDVSRYTVDPRSLT